jgi:two-component system cell cycle sensor histidine kinase/response regulator CckA
VLFVEDDPHVRAQIAPRLRAAGYTVVEAEDGLAGLLAYQRTARVDVVVSDVVMPRLSGPAMIEELRRRGAVVPAVLVSGYSDDPRVAEALPEGAVFLPKPYTVAKLREVLAEATAARVAVEAR